MNPLAPRQLYGWFRKQPSHRVVSSWRCPVAFGEPVLYGGLGGRGVSTGPRASTNDGSLVIVARPMEAPGSSDTPPELRESPAWRSAWTAGCSVQRKRRVVSPRRPGRPAT